MKRINLFLKIYLAFWLTILITVGVLVYLDRLMTTQPMMKHWQDTVDKTVSFYAEQAVASFDNDSDFTKNSFERLEKTTGMTAYLFNEKGVEVTGRTVREDIRKQVSLAIQKSAPTYMRAEDSSIAIKKVNSPNGHAYIFAAVFPHPGPPAFAPVPPPPIMSFTPPTGHPPFLPIRGPLPHGFDLIFFIRLMIGLLITGIFCYLLARYLTAPIYKLGSAARQLADGQLSVRVWPTLKGRGGEISSLANDFDIMAERIEKLLTSQRHLLRDVSHELRSPLARLNIALELCRQHSGEQAQKHLDRMALETRRLNNLIGQVLTYNKMDAETVKIQKTKFDLSKLVEEIVEDANYETNNRRAVIRLNESIILTGNHDLLRRAIENIIRNALCHTPEDSPVEISQVPIVAEGKAQIHITVRDHGCGVPEDDLTMIFKPFFKIVRSGRHNVGTGLGLAISEAAIRLHNGTIRAENADDNGLIIEIFLPIESPASLQ